MAMDAAVAKAFGLTGDPWQRYADPRVFPPPRSLDHWTSRGAGEKYWGTGKERPIPVNHRMAQLYDDMTLSAPGSPPQPH
jgi:hypothetical protein